MFNSSNNNLIAKLLVRLKVVRVSGFSYLYKPYTTVHNRHERNISRRRNPELWKKRRRFDEKDKQRIKERLVRRDGWKCVGCHNPFPLDDLTIDHIVPLGEGGKNKMTNYRLLCWTCHEKLNQLNSKGVDN